MNPAYWDAVAADYENAVLSVFDHDTAGLVRTRITQASDPAATAADLGCGVGKFTPLLAAAFARVEACDRSARGVQETRDRCHAHANVTVRQFDLACDRAPFLPVEFVLCVNVLLMPSLDERRRTWRAVTNQIARGGTLLLVVPSLESVQFEQFLAIETRLQAGDSCTEAVQRSVSDEVAVADLQQGVHSLDGVPTKHYLREELEQLLPGHECDVTELVKLEYRAEATSDETTGKPQAPAMPPWDWLVMARRR